MRVHGHHEFCHRPQGLWIKNPTLEDLLFREPLPLTAFLPLLVDQQRGEATSQASVAASGDFMAPTWTGEKILESKYGPQL